MADLVKIETARRMRAEGKLLREIAAALNVCGATESATASLYVYA
jgi:hypothetical protein